MNCENCMGKFDKETMEDALLNWNEKDFIRYLNTHFSIEGKSESPREKVNVLRSLDEVVLEIASARIDGLEKIYDDKHIIFFIGALIAAATPAVTAIFLPFTSGEVHPSASGEVYPRIAASFFTLCSLMFFKTYLGRDKNILAVLVSFRKLLEQALDKKSDESD
ncbi:hypothetical protein [Bacillus altitudinis]|uniref:hypothetical protein n=1 Tax=Bacillus altitudinis TaxID=293387 RepID=UPI0020D02567|nr:hypothetical protein [Bacillus altitudinis]